MIDITEPTPRSILRTTSKGKARVHTEQPSTSHQVPIIPYEHQVDLDANDENIAPSSLRTTEITKEFNPAPNFVNSLIFLQSGDNNWYPVLYLGQKCKPLVPYTIIKQIIFYIQTYNTDSHVIAFGVLKNTNLSIKIRYSTQ